MFEEFDFETLVGRMLEKVNDKFDKREGSVIYDAVAPAAQEISNFYIVLDMMMNEVFAESASYYYLIKRAAEKGLYPKEETYAIGKMVVTPVDTAIRAGDRFNLDLLNYEVIEAIEGEKGAYMMQCETAGTVGNQQLGILLPIEHIDGLETAELTEILIPGEEEEDVETFRKRYFASFSSEGFGGNKTDYMEKVNDIDGVGGCKVIRMWKQGYEPSKMIPAGAVTSWFKNQSEVTVGSEVYGWLKLIYEAAAQKLFTVGGTVKVIIITSEFKAPSATLLNTVQQMLDPPETAGEGDGLAPIGHVVNVVGVQDKTVEFDFSITYENGYTFADVKESIEDAIDSYFLQLRETWMSRDATIIRINQIEALILNLKGIVEVTDTKINGINGNLILDTEYIPVRGNING